MYSLTIFTLICVCRTGVGVYISRVEEGSVAERAGLRPGDSILEVNGTPFTGISHEEALKVSQQQYTILYLKIMFFSIALNNVDF